MRVENFALQLFDTAPKKRSLLGQSEECAITKTSFVKSDFSIGHRGACMQYPEHTIESYEAAAMQGAGIIECDVTFTKDEELICKLLVRVMLSCFSCTTFTSTSLSYDISSKRPPCTV